MYTDWTKHLRDPKEKAEFERTIQGSKIALDRLKVLLDEKEQVLNQSEMSFDTFDKPNWDYRQAYQNGFRACLNGIRKLVDLDKQGLPKQ